MKNRLLIIGAVALTSALALTGCSATSGGVVGTWGEPDVQGKPSLVLEKDGTVHGNDGCNNLVGTYTYEKSTVTFGPLAATMMYCDGVDTWLGEGTTATVADDTMTVFDSSGIEIGTLNRN